MDAEEKLQYTQYFYNSILEFVYFVIICIESRSFLLLSNICKHIKFFKVEVHDFITSFHGNTLEEKLCGMLNILKCFVVTEDKIRINRNMCVKNLIFEDLIVSKSVDLVLKGITSVDKIYRNLNFNSVIFVEKKYLVNLLKKSSHFSVENDFLSVHHIHGILAFDDHSCDIVTNYFQNILQDNKILSYDEIVQHSKFMSCGVHSILAVFCILYCSKHFQCENGHISLRKVLKKYPKLKPVNVELLAQDILSTSSTIGEIIRHKYGSRVQKWFGEISALNDWFGCIYCVVDFTNGGQGVFRVYFTKTSLKEISEICSLKDYFNVRDKVQFDADYVKSQKPERCWKASRIKALSEAKLNYDEQLLEKMKLNSDVQRKNCSRYNYFGGTCMNCSNYNKVDCIANLESSSEDLFPEINTGELDKYCLASQNLSKEPISNLYILDYMFMFGSVFMLMEDKGIAISEQGNKLYNVLFMKDSVYTTGKSKIYPVKGQKVLLFVPFLGEMESISVAILVYGLTENETKDVEEKCIIPKDFAIYTFLPNICEDTGRMHGKSCCNTLNNLLTYQPKIFVIHEENKIQLRQIYDFMQRHFKVMHNENLMYFLTVLSKANSGYKDASDTVTHMIVKLAKCLFTQYTSQTKCKVKFKKNIKKTGNHFIELCHKNLFPKFPSSSTKVSKAECLLNVDAITKCKSLNVCNDSCSSLNSYKSCSSMNSSSETYYSFDSKQDTKSSDSLTKIEDTRNTPFGIPNKELPSQHMTISNSDCIYLLENLCEDSELQQEMRFTTNKCKRSNQSKYFCLKSLPNLKHTFNKKRRLNMLCHAKCVCQNCYENSCTVTARISLISESFLFYNVNVCGHNVVLPLPRKALPKNVEENFRLNSCSEITVIPNTPKNLSHILAIN